MSKHLDGKALFTGILFLYAAIHREMTSTLQSEQVESEQEFRKQKRRKRNLSDKQSKPKSKTEMTSGSVSTPRAELSTRKFFAPLRTEIDLEGDKETTDEEKQRSTTQAVRPPIILTSTTNLLQLQKNICAIVQGSIEFRNKKNGTRVLTKEMADYSAIMTFFLQNNLKFYTFFPKSLKPIKAVLRNMPTNTPAGEIYEALVYLGFDVASIRQMTTSRRPNSEDIGKSNLPLFLITLPRTEKSQRIFKLTGLCHICIKVEDYRKQNGLTQCYNCQQFGYVWANCNQHPRCMWCGGGHLHKDCPEKINEESTPACCNCTLADGEKPHPSNYRGCSHAREEVRRRRAQRAPKNTTGRVFSSNHTKPGVSFAAALRNSDDQKQPQPQRASVAGPTPVGKRSVPAPARQKDAGQSVPATNVNSPPLDNMLRAVIVVQQIMTEFNDAVEMGGRTTYWTLPSKRAPFQNGVDR
jgi:hypothetical protein